MTGAQGPERPPAGPAGTAGFGTGVLLVVERDPGVAELERLYLAREGFEVVIEPDPGAAAAIAAKLRPVAVVLDLAEAAGAVPYDQIAAAARPAPIVCVTAAGQDPPPGAAHHVVRPFSPRRLVAAVATVLRGEDDGPAPPGVLRSGAVTLDRRTRTVVAAGRSAALTAAEFDLLEFLLRNPGRVFSREQLLAGAWDVSGGVGARTVDVHIAQLRAKLGETSPIRTVRGVGYIADQ
ncbi:MAG TPA: response regulator transcription factor [Streptosporangiaceae bacterium]|nr:response regulator transcription factor [Streptosporangiaceae bacterium]